MKTLTKINKIWTPKDDQTVLSQNIASIMTFITTKDGQRQSKNNQNCINLVSKNV